MSALRAIRWALRDRTLPEPTYGEWLTHKCDPPCGLMRTAEAQRARREMSRRELILAAEQADNAWTDLHETFEMERSYANDLENHLQAHGCSDLYGHGDA